VWVDATDLDRMYASGASAVHLPQSNMYLGVGIAPVAEMLRRGLVVALGTDDANCNDRVQLLAECRAAALLARAAARQPDVLSSERALEMATLDGARSLGRQGSLGSLEPGKQADVAVFALDQPGVVPYHHVPATLVYQGADLAARWVIVGGRMLLDDGRPAWLDEAAQADLLAEAQRRSTAVLARAGLEPRARPGWRPRPGETTGLPAQTPP
jgi:atrazine chlorohydrolase/5-methylthioadenosine/S-adenosylhomocysteine deaminase/melamine deaminase